MTEKTYTKSDLMVALNVLKNPTDIEKAHGDTLSGSIPLRHAIIGAESLIYALEGGEDPRDKLTSELAKDIFMEMLSKEAPNIASILGVGVSQEAERITTPPQEDDA